MESWEAFEHKCTDYLNMKFGAYAKFIHQGGADSTVPDILVKTKAGEEFYIDAKHSPAQCGQFVLLPDIRTSTFEYSRQNATCINDYAIMIMDFMNESFDAYREAGTTGLDIDMPNREEVFSEWIIDAYLSKGARYFITNDFVLFPIERIRDYFEITAKYRIKRSGSSDVGRSRIDMVSDFIVNQYYVIGTRTDVDKLFVRSNRDLDNQRFIISPYEYMFSLRDREYEIRKLSNTYNANVIFTVTRRGNDPGMSDSAFISDLRRS